MNQAIAVARYRFRTTFNERWSGYLSIIILLAVLGGVSLGCLSAARRTQSSFTTFLASTDPSQLRLGTAVFNPAVGFNSGYDPTRVRQISQLPHVRTVESAVLLNAVPYLDAGRPSAQGVPAAGDPTGFNSLGSVDGLYFKMNRLTITKGRMANPKNPYEVVLPSSPTPQGIKIGQLVAFGIYSNAQESRPGFSTAEAPYRRIVVKVVGFGESNDAVIADAIDKSGSFDILFTPALTKSFLDCCARATPDTGIQVKGGNANVVKVENEVSELLSKGFGTPNFYVSSVTEGKAERSIKPESLALGLFGLIAGLATLLIVGQTISRHLRRGADDKRVLSALGASTITNLCESLIGIGGCVGVGALLAVGIAVGLSPLGPIGPVRAVYPDSGIAFDWTVITVGFVTLLATIGLFAIAIAYRLAVHRDSQRHRARGAGRAKVLRRVAALGLSAPEIVGVDFAVNPGAGRNTVPVRSAILGVGLALMVATATLTFGASLRDLVLHPSLYGWNWNYELLAGGGSGDVPHKLASTLLNHDHGIEAWSGVYFATLKLDGQLVPVLGATPRATVAPPLLQGHPFDAPNQILLGTQTLAQLHKRIGDTVEVRNGSFAPTRLTIVGTVVMPAIGSNFTQHLEMGTGALLSYKIIPPFRRNPLGGNLTGPNAILVRLRPSASSRSLQQIANALSTTTNSGVGVQSVQQPAEILNYRSIGAAPDFLALAIAIGASLAFVLTLVSTVQRRRRDLAILKTLGFTRRQLAAVVAWQATIDFTIGAVGGVFIGVIAGRWLWSLFARNIGVISKPAVPVVSIILVVLGALILSNIAAAVPGFMASRSKPAMLFRAE